MAEQQPRLLADRWELRKPIGRGTMGMVWRAFDRSLGREVAVKEIRQDPALGPVQRQELKERMLREGRMAARVSHPSVATIHDAIEIDGSPWIIMELVEGRSLEQVIDEEGPLPPRLVAEIGYDLIGALRAAHAQGILHRDVKPGNVLLTETGRVVLTDFGIAKAMGDSALTQTGMVIGSPGYTAPERARGTYTGPESDLWSLGATLYFAVEGRPAYERSSVSETLNALLTETADPPVLAGPLHPVLDGLLEKDPTKRLTPDRAAAMLRVVADTPAGRPVQMPPAPPPTPSEPPPSAKPAAPAESRPHQDESAVRPSAADPGPTPDTPEGSSDQTMLIIRPKAGLRIPSAGPQSDPRKAEPPQPESRTAEIRRPQPWRPEPRQPEPRQPEPRQPESRPSEGEVSAGEVHDSTVPGRLPAQPRIDSAPPPQPSTPSAPVPPPAVPGRPPAGQQVPPPRVGGASAGVPWTGWPPGPGANSYGPPPMPGPGPMAGPPPGRPLDSMGLGTDLFSAHEPPPRNVAGRVRVLVLMAIAFIVFVALVITAMIAFG